MEDFVKIIIIMVAVIGPLIAGGIKKAADKKAKEKLDEARRRYGDRQPQPNAQRPKTYTQYGTQQWAPPPKVSNQPLPTPAATARQFALDEGAIAQEAQAQYAQYAPIEASQEQARPSFDAQFKGDVAVGEVGKASMVGDPFSADAGRISISSFDTQGDIFVPTTTRPTPSAAARDLLGPLAGPALKRAILMREILGPPKALEM